MYLHSEYKAVHHIRVILLTVKCSGGDNVVQITAHLVSCTATNGCEYSLFIAQLSLIALLNEAKYITALIWCKSGSICMGKVNNVFNGLLACQRDNQQVCQWNKRSCIVSLIGSMLAITN